MSSNTHNTDKRLSAIAIAREGNKLKAVEIIKPADSYDELCWAKSSENSDTSWQNNRGWF
jgi:hypothetical protein